MKRNFDAWNCGVLQSLRDYLHTDKCERLCTEAKNIEQRLRNALDSVQAMTLTSNAFTGRLAYGARRYTSDIEQQIFAELWTTYPVRRKDETSRERLLAYDLYQNNNSLLNSPRVSIIYDLMGLDGVKNALGMRTIERLISEWAEASKKYRHKRYIFSHKPTGTDNHIEI